MAPLHINRPAFGTYAKGILILVLILGIGWYVHFQARFFIAGPQIELETPETTLQDKRTVAVSGHAANITELTLNGRVIHTDESGRFDELLILPVGYTIMTLHAEDRYGRETTLFRSLVYQNL